MNQPIVIVGAGITGLTAGEIISRDHPVIILEREDRVGGLARTFKYDEYRFDIGPHRFHTHQKQILEYIHRILQENAITIGRKSSVYFRRRYFNWPLTSDAIFKLPPSIAIRCICDLIMKNHSLDNEPITFEDYILAQYGRTLYELFFKQYTEKFAYVGCDQLHHSWASASVQRAIIDKRVKMNTLWDVARSVLIPRQTKTTFIYPEGGTMTFCEKQKQIIELQGGHVFTGIRNLSLTHSFNRINSMEFDGETLEPSMVIWTAPVTQFLSLINANNSTLRFMNTGLFNLILKSPPKRLDQWIYFSSKSIVFARASNPAAFHPCNIPEGKGGLCIEVMCHNPEWWTDPCQLKDRVIKDIEDVGLCASEDIEEIFIEKIPDTYPIYSLDYLDERQRVLNCIHRFRNVLAAGRCGAFIYNNMDDSILMGINAAAKCSQCIDE